MKRKIAKRGIEKGAATFSIIVSCIELIGAILLLGLGIYYLCNPIVTEGAVYINYDYTIGVTYTATAVALLILNGIIILGSNELMKIASAKDEDNTNKNHFVIILLTLSLLTCNFVTTGLLVSVLCIDTDE